jgi:sulfatase modifying factor 1
MLFIAAAAGVGAMPFVAGAAVRAAPRGDPGLRDTPPHVVTAIPGSAASRREVPQAGSSRVPAGSYRPFYRTGAAPTPVRAFVIDDAPVSVGAFLDFVRSEPRWRRSLVRGAFAEPTYLRRWRGDLDPGGEGDGAPVAEVSWFAARAFCASRGGRLPTTVEWERVFGSADDRPSDTGTGRFAFAQGHRAADLVATAIAPGPVWEWTFDFDSAAAAAGPSQFCGDGVRSRDPADYGAFLRFSFRASLRGNYALRDLGFRCAKDALP